MERTFTAANDQTLVSALLAPTRKILFVGAGLTIAVSEALERRLSESADIRATIILDCDPETCRLGYGDLIALELVKHLADEKKCELRHQPGLRIGLLVTDEQTVIFAPVPRLIEAGPAEADKPNAIVLRDIPLPQIDHACGIKTSMNLEATVEPEIGCTSVTKNQMTEIKEDLEENPPKQFDLARLERVFNSRIQYVDFSLENYRLSKKAVPIPHDLMGLSANKDLQERWHNTFKVFDKLKGFSINIKDVDEKGNTIKDEHGHPIEIKYGEEILEAEKKQIVADYLFVLRRFGTVLLRSQRGAFQKAVDRLGHRIEAYRKAVEARLETALDESIGSLLEYVTPLCLKDIPARFRKASLGGPKLEEGELRELLREDLRRSLKPAKDHFKPDLTVLFKDVPYETTRDPKFMDELKRVMPPKTVEKLFSEHNAAPERIATAKQ